MERPVDSTTAARCEDTEHYLAGGWGLLNTMDLDDVWVYLGDFGRYQTVAFILITLVGTWLPAWQIFGIIFTTAQPPFHCRASPGFTLEESVPRMGVKNESFAECLMYAVEKGENGTSFINTSSQVECTNGYEFVTLFDENTIVMEVSLVPPSSPAL